MGTRAWRLQWLHRKKLLRETMVGGSSRPRTKGSFSLRGAWGRESGTPPGEGRGGWGVPGNEQPPPLTSSHVYLNRKCTEGRFPGPVSATSPCTSGPSSPAALGVRCRVSRIQGHMRAHSRQQGDRPAEAEADGSGGQLAPCA